MTTELQQEYEPRQDRSRPLNQRKPLLLSRISRQSRFYWVRQLLENPSAVVSLVFLILTVTLTLAIPYLSDQDPSRLNPAFRLEPPSRDYWLGTDHIGRDVLLRSIYGVRVSLAIGLAVMVACGLVGTVLGLVSGYYPRLDTPIMRVMDGIMAFPSVLLAIAIMASIGASSMNVVVALSVVYTPMVARLIRGATLSIKHQAYVEAARSMGAIDYLILARHVFPNTLSPLIVQCTYVVALAITAEAALSFLGAGVPPEVPTWGSMLREGRDLVNVAWWMVVAPGTSLFFTVLALNLTGDALRDALDPRSRER